VKKSVNPELSMYAYFNLHGCMNTSRFLLHINGFATQRAKHLMIVN